MLNPWVILCVVLAWGATTGGAYWYGNNVGKDSERVVWQGKQSKELQAANAKIIDLTEKARAQESLHAVELAGISAKYQEALQNEKSKSDRVIADVRAGTRKLRIPIAGPIQTCGSSSSQAPAAAERRDGEARAELSGSSSDFLIGLASEADAIVRQLTACQAVILQDRTQAERPVK